MQHLPAPKSTCAAALPRGGCQTPPPSAVQQRLGSALTAWVPHDCHCRGPSCCRRWLSLYLRHKAQAPQLPAGSRGQLPGGFPAPPRRSNRRLRLHAAAAAQKGRPGAGRGWRSQRGRRCRGGWSSPPPPAVGRKRRAGLVCGECFGQPWAQLAAIGEPCPQQPSPWLPTSSMASTAEGGSGCSGASECGRSKNEEQVVRALSWATFSRASRCQTVTTSSLPPPVRSVRSRQSSSLEACNGRAWRKCSRVQQFGVAAVLAC